MNLSRDKESVKDLPLILICVDAPSGWVSSYLMRMANHSIMVPTNHILLPSATVIDYSSDLDERTIFLLTELPIEDSYIKGRYELHVFSVQNSILWKTMIPFSKLSNISIFSYNFMTK